MSNITAPAPVSKILRSSDGSDVYDRAPRPIRPMPVSTSVLMPGNTVRPRNVTPVRIRGHGSDPAIVSTGGVNWTQKLATLNALATDGLVLIRTEAEQKRAVKAPPETLLHRTKVAKDAIGNNWQFYR